MGGLYISEMDERRAKAAVANARKDPVAFARSFFRITPGVRQSEYLRLNNRVQVAICGRRWGKSTMSLIKAVHACLTKPNQKWVIAGPSIDQANIYFKDFEQYMSSSALLKRLVVPGSLKYNPYPIVEFKSGSTLTARSTTLQGRYLRGMGLDGIVVTEAAFVPEGVWNEVIRALLLDRKGTAIVETTPNGAGNWTYRLYQKGLATEADPEDELAQDDLTYYGSFHATCYENERLDRLEIERIKRELPDLAFRQEYLAEFVDDQSVVFPWHVLERVFDDDYSPKNRPDNGHRYVIGVDLAKYRDWTVICVLDTTEEPYRIAEWHRFQGRRSVDVAALVNELCEKYAAKAYLDATGVGEAVAEEVRAAERVVFTPKVRDDIISELLVAVEQARVKLPAGLTELRDEMRHFRRVEHGSRVKAEAPRGEHDDAVFGLGLAVYGARAGGWRGLFEWYKKSRDRIVVGNVIKLDKAREEAGA